MITLFFERFPIAETNIPLDITFCWHPAIHTSSSGVSKLTQDVLLLIAEELHPRDLAALMNTCKSMRVVLRYSSHLNVHGYIKLNEP